MADDGGDRGGRGKGEGGQVACVECARAAGRTFGAGVSVKCEVVLVEVHQARVGEAHSRRSLVAALAARGDLC